MAELRKPMQCFIIMPITTPQGHVDGYKGDVDHFSHVLEHLFVPAVEKAGFTSVSPKSAGSDVIQAEIITNLASSDLVLCDMSCLNPNVFFEFGIRTALDKPVALVADDRTTSIPFDTSIINFHRYNSALSVWALAKEIDALSAHIHASFQKAGDHNALWRYFGVPRPALFKPEDSLNSAKMDILIQEVAALRRDRQDRTALIVESLRSGKITSPPYISAQSGTVPQEKDEKELQAEIQRIAAELAKQTKSRQQSLPADTVDGTAEG